MAYKNRADYDAWNERRAAENAAALRELKSKPCFDCAVPFPHYMMEFVHVPERGPKLATIGELCGSRKITAPTLVAELAKCDLLCANCARARVWFEGRSKD